MKQTQQNKKIALITGATSGIGKETALLFAEKNIEVIITGRKTNEGMNLQKEIHDLGGVCHFIPADIATQSGIETLFKEISTISKHLDFCVNNASIEGASQQIFEIEEENWDSVLDINLKGVLMCLKHEFHLMKNHGGAIVNISSCLTKLAAPYTAAYTASKAGVEALSRVASIEYSKYNIRVNSIAPGAVDTPMLKRIYSNEDINNMKATNPLSKIASPKDIANAIYWLCSNKSSHINGISMLIDGGHTLTM